MKRDTRWTVVILAMLLGVAGSFPCTRAQEEAAEEEEPERLGVLYAEVASWVAQPVGLGYTPATVSNPAVPADVELLHTSHGTKNRQRYKLGYAFHHNIGEFVVTYYEHVDSETLRAENPGQFLFGETLTAPFHAGVNDDGLADAFDASVGTKLRETRLDYYRPAFSGERARGKWFVGVRRVSLRRNQDASYFALVPGLPPILPPVSNPRPDLDPIPDIASLESDFDGRGAEAGLDLQFPLWKERILFEAGFAVVVLRGSIDATYQTRTFFYAVVDPTTGDIQQVLAPPYSEFEDPAQIDNIEQRPVTLGRNVDGISTNASAMEIYLGFRWNAWRGLDVIGGFRNIHYDDVGLDLQIESVSVSSNGVLNLQDVTQIERSAGYEGYYLGIAYTY